MGKQAPNTECKRSLPTFEKLTKNEHYPGSQM